MSCCIGKLPQLASPPSSSSLFLLHLKACHKSCHCSSVLARISSKTKIGRLEVARKRTQQIYEETLHSLLRIYRVSCLRFSSPVVLLLMVSTTLYSSRAHRTRSIYEEAMGICRHYQAIDFHIVQFSCFFPIRVTYFCFCRRILWLECVSVESEFFSPIDSTRAGTTNESAK